jgi:hypothetical protein
MTKHGEHLTSFMPNAAAVNAKVASLVAHVGNNGKSSDVWESGGMQLPPSLHNWFRNNLPFVPAALLTNTITARFWEARSGAWG